jgi:MFS family permease
LKFDNRPAAAADHTDKLFTPRFFILWAYNFIVFLSAFQLLPTAPFHILSLGGSHVAAGLFLGFLTYASAISAPITGALADRWGKRNMLLVAALALTGFSILYAFAPSYQLILALVLIHGVFWSCLLSSSSAYMLDIVPASRRAEGLGYSGFASILAIAVAPWLGL